jgi:UPF0716 family protein affecting phage T7 exclusion
MSFDSIASLQRMGQMQQAEAASGKRLVLRRMESKLDIAIIIVAILLIIPTLTFSILAWLIYFLIREATIKTYIVKNVATGERFRVRKEDFKQYKKEWKNREKQIRNISDL